MGEMGSEMTTYVLDSMSSPLGIYLGVYLVFTFYIPWSAWVLPKGYSNCNPRYIPMHPRGITSATQVI